VDHAVPISPPAGAADDPVERNALLYTPTSLAGYWTAWRTETIVATAGTPDELNTKSI
jgi:hypothetical protein